MNDYWEPIPSGEEREKHDAEHEQICKLLEAILAALEAIDSKVDH